jgi:hypothetical protein
MRDLEKTDDLDFAVCILNERRADLNAYSPLSVKLAQSVKTIQDIKAERDKYLYRLEQEREKFCEAITGERSTRNMTEEEYAAFAAEMTRRTLMQLLAKFERPDGDRLSEIIAQATYEIEALQEDISAEDAPEPSCEFEDDGEAAPAEEVLGAEE